MAGLLDLAGQILVIQIRKEASREAIMIIFSMKISTSLGENGNSRADFVANKAILSIAQETFALYFRLISVTKSVKHFCQKIP